MADAANEVDESALEGAAPLSESSDSVLAEGFRKAGEGDGLESHDEITGEAEKPEIDLKSIQAQIDELREKNESLRVENDVYKQGLLNRPREIIREVAPQAAPEKPKAWADSINIEEINNGLRTDPGATIAKLLKDAHNAAREEITREVTEKATDTVSGMSAHMRAFQQDQNAAVTEFGELLKENNEFKDLAERIYSQMTEGGTPIDKNGNLWVPNAIYASMAIAHSQMVRQGKIAATPQTETPAQNKGTVISLVPKKKPVIDSMLGDTK